MNKTCTKCDETKPVGEFPWRSKANGIRLGRCKKCDNLRKREWAETNKERLTEKRLKYEADNKEHLAARAREYYQANRQVVIDRTAQWRKDNPGCRARQYEMNKEVIIKRNTKYVAENPEIVAERKKRWYEENKERIAKDAKANRARTNRIKRERTKNDPTYRMTCRLRGRFKRALQGRSKSASTIELLGAHPDFVRQYIEDQFSDGMSWDNIHIDHIRPCASFDLSDPEQQRQCFHYSNLQPMWPEDNMSKRDKWDGEMHVALEMHLC